MNAIRKTQIKLLLVILGVIALAHLVVIGLFIKTGRDDSPAPVSSATEAKAAAASPNAAEATAPAPVPAGKPGFWQRLFGKSPAKQEAKAETPVAPKAPEKIFKYRKLSENPNFGKPFNYETVCRQNIPSVPFLGEAKSGIMVDMDTRNVLWAKNEKSSGAIASMVKMMTLLVAFEEMEKRSDVTLDTIVPVTKETMRVPRTGVVFLDVRESFSVRDLMKTAAIKSANDAAYLIADFFSAGDVDGYVRKMNDKAAELKMENTAFTTPHGLPNAAKQDSVSSAEGMIILGERLLEYPDYMKWSGTQQDSIRDGKFVLLNTNHLINPRYPGVDGLKTGFTNKAGFCVTVSAVRNGKRIMLCLMGYQRAGQGRDPAARRLLDWGYLRAEEIEKGKIKPDAKSLELPVPGSKYLKNTAAKAESKPVAKTSAKKPSQKK